VDLQQWFVEHSIRSAVNSRRAVRSITPPSLVAWFLGGRWRRSGRNKQRSDRDTHASDCSAPQARSTVRMRATSKGEARVHDVLGITFAESGVQRPHGGEGGHNPGPAPEGRVRGGAPLPGKRYHLGLDALDQAAVEGEDVAEGEPWAAPVLCSDSPAPIAMTVSPSSTIRLMRSVGEPTRSSFWISPRR
jgi:hypothetical protein